MHFHFTLFPYKIKADCLHDNGQDPGSRIGNEEEIQGSVVREEKSPLSGRNIKTFERTYVKDETTWHEESNPYYRFYEEEKVCNMILHEFGLYSERSHIINGHTPVRTSKGEHPVRANGRLMVIDGAFAKLSQDDRHCRLYADL